LPYPRSVRAIALACTLLASTAGAAEVSFNKDIRPIMSDTCFRCHGPDKSSRMAGMRLDLREEALKPTRSGITPIVPGDPDKSAIIQRIFAAAPAKLMPPAYSHKTLTEAQKQTIRRWVAEGAKYEGHWAYMPVKRPATPPIDGPTVRNPIDAFIQQRLRQANLSPSPEADRRTLIRRVSLDLTGLPPQPAEVEAFVKDRSPDAYERLVDRLLASPAYAEKMTIHWLDAVRYADSAGFHGDNPYPTWPYRDYVLRAFRDNMPFDEFTREQLAGDLIPNATTDQRVASAFNRLTRASAEGGIQPKEYLAKYGADRVRTVSNVWLGSTMGCAECHDHKFDPIATKDFYSMKAFFADIDEAGLVADSGPLAWGAKLRLPSEDQKLQMGKLDRELFEAKCDLETAATARWAEREAWEKRVAALHDAGDLDWHYQRPLSATAVNGAKLTIYNEEELDYNFYLHGSLAFEHKRGDGLIVAGGPNPDNETYTVTFKPGPGTWRALAVQAQQDEGLPAVRLARGADRFVLSEVEAETGGRKLPFVLATTTGFGEAPQQGAMAAIDGDPRTGWGVSSGEHRSPMLALRFAAPLVTGADSVITVRLRQESSYRRATIGRFRLALASGQFSFPDTGDSGAQHEARQGDAATLSAAPDRGVPPEVLDALKLPEEQRSRAQRTAVLRFYAWSDPELQPLVVRSAKAELARNLLEAAIPRVMVSESVEPRETRVLPRGDWMNESGAIVEPAVPGFLGKLETADRRANRLDLANWVVSPSNPLTARVFANRMWREYFGTGLSKVLEDLGSQGEWPTHPELLDWLSAEFMQPSWQTDGTHTWDVKHLARTIVTSYTYRQSSSTTPQLEEKDPYNRLLARQSRFRVDAEVVHDIALSVSGLLVEQFGGPSVRPYQPDGYLAAMNFPKREYSASHGPDLYRRGVYTVWQRTFLHPAMANFDAPSREECTVNRVSSNTPLQALDLLNDPIYVEAARVFAQNIVRQGGKSLDGRIDWAFEKALSRAPEPLERAILEALYRKNLVRFRASPDSARDLLAIGDAPAASGSAPELAAMTTVARAILNLHETVTRN
jgi:hypothetical protein